MLLIDFGLLLEWRMSAAVVLRFLAGDGGAGVVCLFHEEDEEDAARSAENRAPIENPLLKWLDGEFLLRELTYPALSVCDEARDDGGEEVGACQEETVHSLNVVSI